MLRSAGGLIHPSFHNSTRHAPHHHHYLHAACTSVIDPRSFLTDPQGLFTIPEEYTYLGHGSSGHVFRVPTGGLQDNVALKIGVVRGTGDLQQAVKELRLSTLLPPSPGLALTTEIVTIWSVPEKTSLPGLPELDAGLAQLFLVQSLPLVKGETLHKACERVRLRIISVCMLNQFILRAFINDTIPSYPSPDERSSFGLVPKILPFSLRRTASSSQWEQRKRQAVAPSSRRTF